MRARAGSLISIASTLFFLTNWGLGAIVTVLVSWAFFWLALAAQGRLIIRAGEEWMGTTKGEKWFYVNGVCEHKIQEGTISTCKRFAKERVS